MAKYFITGVAGTGKSTIAEKLRNDGFSVIDLDTISYWRNKQTGERVQDGVGKDFINAHDWICDASTLQSSLEPYNTVFVVGINSNQNEFLRWFDTVFLLQCSKETLLHRLNTREKNDFGKEKSEQEQILSWYNDFEERMVKLGAIPVNTEQPIDVVVEEIKNNISD